VSDGVTVGRSDARVTIDLYEDPQCPVCRQLETDAGATIATWVESGRAKVRYHVISFLDRVSPDKFSSRAANALYCAADAGVYARYHDLVFANQPAEGQPGPTSDQLIALGRQAGATGDAFGACVSSGRYADFVNRISEQSSKDGILGTPTVLVNGNPVQPVTLANITAAVNGAS
jgi:protein-disulfide isomerase